jgi:hypothetical protein
MYPMIWNHLLDGATNFHQPVRPIKKDVSDMKIYELNIDFLNLSLNLYAFLKILILIN